MVQTWPENDFQSDSIISIPHKLYTNKRPPGLIAPPFIIGFLATDNLPKLNEIQVEVNLNNAQNHLSSP